LISIAISNGQDFLVDLSTPQSQFGDLNLVAKEKKIEKKFGCLKITT
jgi:hypothetical protein